MFSNIYSHLPINKCMWSSWNNLFCLSIFERKLVATLHLIKLLEIYNSLNDTFPNKFLNNFNVVTSNLKKSNHWISLSVYRPFSYSKIN